jgi:hypothetical protein
MDKNCSVPRWHLISVSLAILVGLTLGFAARAASAPLARTITPPHRKASLQQLFQSPPADTRIMVRWWWFGPSATNGELLREMESMKTAGIGGFEVQPVYPLALNDPGQGFQSYPYLSDRFIQALRFAATTSRRLGLRMDLTLGSGWPYGGPTVPVTEAAGKLRFVVVAAPEHGDLRLPLPSITTGEKLLAVFLAKGRVLDFDATSSQPLDTIRDGAVWLPENLEGPHVVMFFISSRTGMMVKRPAIGAEGFVLDHYDRAATDHYLQSVGGRLMQAFGATPPYAIFCDSLEVNASDWTPTLLEEFERRRGYSLKPYLPVLLSGQGPNAAAVRHDWGQTLSEIFEDNFVKPVEAWAKLHHTLFRAQLYGVPPALLSSYRFVDLAEGEGAHWRQFAPVRWAASANHIYGRTITSSETWTWLHSPAFRATPLDMKAEADVHFLEGSNQLVAHGWPYSPPEAGEPGWRFYAAAAFGPHNPWWIVMPDVSLYLERVSLMLRQGNPANDVAIYLPVHDAWAQFRPGRVSVSESMNRLLGPDLIPALNGAGYGFDFIDDTAIDTLGAPSHGALEFARARYPVIILPGVERMPLGTLQKLAAFVKAGGVLIATRRIPSLSPGLQQASTQSPKVARLARQLFRADLHAAHFVENERQTLANTLQQLQPPDVTFSPAAADVGFVHRDAGTRQIYFLANTSNHFVQSQATFRVSGVAATWWNPMTGTQTPAIPVASHAATTAFALSLEPYGSRLLVFEKGGHSAADPQAKTSQPSARPQAGELPAPIDISSGWKVTFSKLNSSTEMLQLRSWTDDPATRFYSGEAVYEKRLMLPSIAARKGVAIWLNFGEGTPVPEQRHGGESGMRAWMESPVREAAVVTINGKRAGSVWHPPYEIEITPWVHPGANTFRIVVGNLALNEMAGKALPDYRLLNSRYGTRFVAQDMNRIHALPSGILQKVQLEVRAAAK